VWRTQKWARRLYDLLQPKVAQVLQNGAARRLRVRFAATAEIEPAYTQGCDLEAHTFAQEKEKFDALGATVIGISADSIERLDQFSADPNYCAGKFPVASDANGKVAGLYNLTTTAAKSGMKDVRGVAIDHDFIERETFVISKDYKIVATFSSKEDHLAPNEHVKKALEIVQQLSAK
jgi:thioredoxin-dependent peroxiredoxin